MTPRLTLVLRDPSQRALLAGAPAGWSALILGRAEEADLRLDHPEVSRRHARLTRQGADLVLQDLGSRAGTRVNGQVQTGPVTLRAGDLLALGPVEIEVRPAQDEHATVPPEAVATLDPDTPDATRLEVRRPGQAAQPVATPVDVLLSGRSRVRLGRGAEADVVLPAPGISRAHADLLRHGDGWTVTDLGSTNGTYVNGQAVRAPCPLRVGDTLRIGPYRFEVSPERLLAPAPAAGLRLEVERLGRAVIDRRDGRPLAILEDISLTVEPGEFLGLLGASGSGKSTFLDALNGRRPATSGQVRVDGHDLATSFHAYKRCFGYVPQELIFHDALPVEDVLRYASLLRLPEDISQDEVERGIDRVLATVGLTLQRATLVRQLSGGQKKRVALAIELLGRPQVLFLDEATSGLDLGSEAQMMALFRELADAGTTVVCITHYVESLDRCDRVAWFVRGRLAFLGTPAALCAHVGVATLREVYVQEAERTPEEWVARFRASPAYAEQVTRRLTAAAPPPGRAPSPAPVRPRPRGALRQARTLTARMLALLTADRRALSLALVLGPLVGLLASLVLRGHADETLPELARRQGQLAFVGTITAFFLGLFGSVREIVKELTIYRHERFQVLRLGPYLASKAVPLLALGALQVLGLLAAIHLLADVRAPFLPHLLVLLAVQASGLLLGLALSAAVDTSDKAITLMLLALLPQLLFANAFIELSGAARLVGAAGVPCYWGHDAVQSLLPPALLGVAGPNGRPLLFGAHTLATDLLALLGFAALFTLLALALLRRRDGAARP